MQLLWQSLPLSFPFFFFSWITRFWIFRTSVLQALETKGAEYSWWDGNRKFTTTNNLLYLEMPAMCNFHLNRNWVLGAGLYCAFLVDDDDRDFDKFDAGLRIGGKYQFDSGFFLGLDASFGGVDLDKHYDAQNITFGTVVGFAF